MGEVLHYLRTVQADQDGEGRFLIAGSGVVSFLGVGGNKADVVIDGDSAFFVKGKSRGLAAGLRGTSYGTGVHVIS